MYVHISEVIECDFKGLFSSGMSGVVFLDEEIVFSELEESVDFFFFFSVVFGVLEHPVFEGDVDLGFVPGDEGVGWGGCGEVSGGDESADDGKD
jgi:hypothetical protein